MADIQAFRGFRYDLGRVGNLSDVIAPPYDVIDAALQQALYDRSPHNVIRLILNKERRATPSTTIATPAPPRRLRDWQQDGVLVQDSARSLYVYHQDFEVEGRRYTRKGFMARVRLEPFGTGRIYPHEETMSGPKADRLKLFQATAMNLSQIFGLYPDDAGEVQAKLDAAVGRALPLQATDHLGVVSKLWPVTDQHAVSAVTGLMGPKPIFIADGHHRYETALKYLEEKAAAGEVTGPDASRQLRAHDAGEHAGSRPGHPADASARLRRRRSSRGASQDAAGRAFRGRDRSAPGRTPPRKRGSCIEADGAQDLLGFGTVADGVWQTARFRAPALMAQAGAPSTARPGAAWRWRAAARGAGQAAAASGRQAEVPVRASAARGERRGRGASSASSPCWCRRRRWTTSSEIAGNLEKMPPKSTYFYPKLLSGLVFHSLKAN